MNISDLDYIYAFSVCVLYRLAYVVLQ